MSPPPTTITWRKRYLLPLWLIRDAIMLFFIGAYIWAWRTLSTQVDFTPAATAGLAIFCLLACLTVLLDFYSAFRFLRGELSVRTFLNVNAFQTGFFVGCLAVQIWYVARYRAGAAGPLFFAGVLLTFLAGLFYAIKQNRRLKKTQHLPAGYEPSRAGVPSPHAYAPYDASQQDALVTAPRSYSPVAGHGQTHETSAAHSYGPPAGHVELGAVPSYGHAGNAPNYAQDNSVPELVYHSEPVRPAHMV